MGRPFRTSFHPELLLSDLGRALLRGFFTICLSQTVRRIQLRADVEEVLEGALELRVFLGVPMLLAYVIGFPVGAL